MAPSPQPPALGLAGHGPATSVRLRAPVTMPVSGLLRTGDWQMLLRCTFADVRPMLMWLALPSVLTSEPLIDRTFGLTALVPFGVPWTCVRTLRIVFRPPLTVVRVPEVETSELAMAEPTPEVLTNEF